MKSNDVAFWLYNRRPRQLSAQRKLVRRNNAVNFQVVVNYVDFPAWRYCVFWNLASLKLHWLPMCCFLVVALCAGEGALWFRPCGKPKRLHNCQSAIMLLTGAGVFQRLLNRITERVSLPRFLLIKIAYGVFIFVASAWHAQFNSTLRFISISLDWVYVKCLSS